MIVVGVAIGHRDVVLDVSFPDVEEGFPNVGVVLNLSLSCVKIKAEGMMLQVLSQSSGKCHESNAKSHPGEGREGPGWSVELAAEVARAALAESDSGWWEAASARVASMLM